MLLSRRLDVPMVRSGPFRLNSVQTFLIRRCCFPKRGGSGPPQRSFEAFGIDCTSAGGVANAVPDKLRSLSADGNSLPPFEYSGTIVVSGRSATLRSDRLETSFETNRSPTSVSGNPAENSNVLGFVHNHPLYGYDQNLDLQARYPSGEDWAAIGKLVMESGVSTNISIFVIDSRGAVREFKYADRVALEALSSAAKIRGDLLPSKITSKDCVGKV